MRHSFEDFYNAVFDGECRNCGLDIPDVVRNAIVGHIDSTSLSIV